MKRDTQNGNGSKRCTDKLMKMQRLTNRNNVDNSDNGGNSVYWWKKYRKRVQYNEEAQGSLHWFYE